MNVRALFGVAWVATACFSTVGLSDEIARQAHYDNHKLVEVQVTGHDQAHELMDIGEMLACRIGPGPQSMVVPPEGLARLDQMGIRYTVLHEDFQELVDLEAAQRAQARSLRGATFHDDYHTYPEIEAQLDVLVAMNPGLVTKQVIGQSLEGRDIYSMVIDGNGDPNAPQLAISGCQHAREWVSTASVMWMMEQLIAGYGSDPEITALVDNVEWHFVPVVNPDGYQYSHTNVRLWRKNRRNNGGGDFGVDLNRNWGYEWGQGVSGSSSSNPGSETYRGPSAFSEPESTVVSGYLSSLTRLKGHIDVHSYGQLILGPWGWNDQIVPPRADELIAVQSEMEQVMTSYAGQTYVAGLGSDQLLYTADGVMQDWTFGVMNALSWTFEMRPISSFPGFELPANQIVPTANEAFLGAKVLANFIQQRLLISLNGLPSELQTAAPLDLDVSIESANLYTLVGGTEKVFYRYGSTGPFTELALTETAPDFSAQIPGGACGSTLEFYVEAQADDGTFVREPADAPTTVQSLDVQNVLLAINDNFETNQGWSTSSSASSGQWQRGTPVNDSGWQYDPTSDGDGSGQCYLTQNQTGNTDVDNGSVVLESPALDMSGGAFDISYLYFLNLTNDDGTDRLLVEINTNGGVGAWTEVARHDTNGGLTWRSHVIEASDLTSLGVTPTSTTHVRFTANDDGTQSIVEAGVDGFVVRAIDACPPSGCPGDADGDNIVDISDLNLVLGNFGSSGAPGIPGDASGDGVVDVTDLNLVIGNFGQNCLPPL